MSNLSAVLAAVDCSLNARQLRILAYVAANPGHSVKPMSEAFGWPKPSITRGLDALENEGFVTRTPSNDDKRFVVVKPTKTGNALLAKMEKAVAKAMGGE